jgi:hypothetical protein
MENIVDAFESMGLSENYDLIAYIRNLKTIDKEKKGHLLYLIECDNYQSYMEIYNICLENDIELPPI